MRGSRKRRKMVRRKQKSCHECRTRHLKCDGETPKCGHCRRGARQCSKKSDHIFLNESTTGIVRRRKHYSLTFKGNQRWIDVPRSVTFTSDTSESTPNPADNSRSITPPQNTTSGFIDRTTYVATQPGVDHPPGTAPELTLSTAGYDTLFPYSGWVALPFSAGVQDLPTAQDTGPPEAIDPALDTSSLFPIRDEQEAMLMRHFVDKLAPTFDHCDSSVSFRTKVPEFATNSPGLLNAIFALSAKHASLIGTIEHTISLRHKDKAVKLLLEDLQQRPYDPAGLTAAVLLWRSGMMTAVVPEASHRCLLPDLSVFMTAWRTYQMSGLHAALFINVLRINIYLAWMGNCIPAVEADCSWMTNCYFPDVTDLWNCKITMLCARTLNFCHIHQVKTPERWMLLDALADDWATRKLASFDPIFQQTPRGDNPFPKLVFAGDLHATAHLYHALTVLLLINNLPQLSDAAMEDEMLRKDIDEQALAILRRACGIAQSHPDSGSVVCTVSLAIAYSGHVLMHPAAQQQAYEILEMARKHSAEQVPPEVYTRLRSAWGWTQAW